MSSVGQSPEVTVEPSSSIFDAQTVSEEVGPVEVLTA